MDAILWLVVALPGLAALAVRFTPAGASPLPVIGALVAAMPSWALLAAAGSGTATSSGFEWLPAAGLDVGLRLDGLAAVMSATVATVGLVVVIYATGYFATDPRRRSALAGLLAFLAAMQGLALADGFLTLLVFWELVGAASARLIAYSRDDRDAAGASVRAFLTTRSADVGLYLAVLALFAAGGDLAFGGTRPDGALGALVGIGLVVAAIGKSAQAPLHTWLSAAMAGPTPVSALLHSATMVAAGVYLLARSGPLLAGWPLELAGWVGATTAVAGAAIALAQSDLKRLLAGSTTSQLGLMFVGMAAGGPAVAMFLLIAHAAGKAGLFLAAGIFQHERGTTSLEGLRGAGRQDRPAFWAFVVSALSIAGIPPLAAFWSKEHIAAATEETRLAWFALVLIATAGAAAYMLRPALILWRGPHQDRKREARGRRPMLAGLAVTAVGSLLIGAVGEPLARLLDAPALPTSEISLLLSLAAVAAGIAAVLAALPVAAWMRRAANRQLYANEVLRALVQRPVLASARVAGAADRRAIDAVVDGVGRGGLLAARASDWIDREAVDSAVDGLARRIDRGGEDLRRLQSGRLGEYLRAAILGAGALAFLIALTALT